MAGLKDSDDYKNGERFKGAGNFGWIALGVGAVATAAFFLIAFADGKTGDGYSMTSCMAFSWLFAVVFFLSIAVGGMFWTLLHHATNSGWGTLVRRLMENLGIMIPVLLFLALPLILPQIGFRDALWEWFEDRAVAESTAEKKADEKKAEYIADIKTKAEKAAGQLAKIEKDKSSQSNITPGVARFYDDQIKSLTEKSEVLAAHANQPEEVLVDELRDKEFKNANALLHAKRDFLQEEFWLLRFGIYILVLGGGMYLLRSTSVRQDKSGDPKLFTKMQVMSCLLLLPFAVAWTFLVFDWLMALDYSWFSTMWGVYLFAGAALNSMGVLILVLSGLRKAGYFADTITKEHYLIMGKLMHAFVIFWAYIAFSQFFLIWYANITEETKFFLTRNTGFWNLYTIIFLVVGHFFIPFIALLIRYNKTTTKIICFIAIWNLLMHFFDIYWIIIAERAPSLTQGAVTHIKGMWMYDLLAFVGVGGIFIFCLLKTLGTASLFPCRDPRLDESLNLTN
ncbi:MAG: hypothetical protein P1V20_30040 [Verrucomicrobiales bacterium]|nr:hypothetical protein [Verrucomicrobiales bacterium]